MFQIQFYDTHFQEWLPATTKLYEKQLVAMADMEVLKVEFSATQDFRVEEI